MSDTEKAMVTTPVAATAEPKPLSDEAKAQLAKLKELASEFVGFVGGLGSSHELSEAVANVRLATLWAKQHLVAGTTAE